MMLTRYSNIVVFGFMGTGKSTAARRVAHELARRYVDIDRVIEEREGCSIAELFEAKGEAAFREMEHEVVKEVAAGEGQVIATGGGVILREDNIQALSRDSLMVCLDASLETILERTGRNANRPLLQAPDREERIKALLEERKPLYARIPVHISTDDRPNGLVARMIVALFHEEVLKSGGYTPPPV